MAAKRKISVRKILQVSLTVVVAVCCVLAIVSASRIEGGLPLKALPVVHISNDRKYQFIEQQHIMDLAIYDRNVDVQHTPVGKLDLRGIEKAIMADPWVADAQVYIDANRIMHMFVTQRVPVARLFRQNGGSYYMDSTLHTMPLSETYTYYTTVVTNVPEIANDSMRKLMKQNIATIVKTVRADSFWNAQVSHINVDSLGEFELIPVLGNHKIKFGDTSRAKEKLGNLMAFYRNVLNRIGWDKYETLDVRFKAQVVAAPSLPYKVDDATFERMSWVASIKAAQEQTRVTDSVRTATRIAAEAAAERLTLQASEQLANAKKNKKTNAKDKKPVLKGEEALEHVRNSLKSRQHLAKDKRGKAKVKKVAKKPETKTPAKAPAAVAAKPVKTAIDRAPAAKAAAKKAPPKAAAKKLEKNVKADPKKKNDKQKDKNKKTTTAKYTYPENKRH